MRLAPNSEMPPNSEASRPVLSRVSYRRDGGEHWDSPPPGNLMSQLSRYNRERN